MKQNLISGLWIVVFSAWIGTTGWADCREDFLREAPAAWKKNDAALEATHVTVQHERREVSISPNGERKSEGNPWRCKLEFYCDGKRNLRLCQRNDGERFVGNPDYAFEIGRMGKNRDWQLEKAVRIREGNIPFAQGPHCFALDTTRHGGTSISGVSLLALARSPYCEWTVAYQVAESGKRFARLDMQYSGPVGEGGTGQPGTRHIAVLDPQNEWLADRIESIIGESTMRTEVEYARLSSGTPCVVGFKFYSETPRWLTEWHYKISLPEPMKLSESEFYLPHYGFSESVIYPNRRNWWWAIALAACGLGLFRFGRILRKPT